MQGRFMRAATVAVSALAMMVPAGALAQTPSENQPAAPQGQQRMGRHGRRQAGPERRLERLSRQLNLTDEQKSKLKPILENQYQQMQALHNDSSLNRGQRRARMRELRKTFRPQILGVLTPDQQAKLKQMQQQRRGKGRGGKNMGEGAGPGL